MVSMGTMLTAQFGHTAENGKKPHILLVSGWQTVNIGDIAHTPGLIHLLKTYKNGGRKPTTELIISVVNRITFAGLPGFESPEKDQ
jgi:hypothetical protein